MYCPACGNELPDGAAFCSKCGTSLKASSTQLAAQSTQAVPVGQQPMQMPQQGSTESASQATQQPQQPQQSQQSQQSQQAAAPSQKPEKGSSNKRRNILIACIVIVVVVVVVGIVGYNMWQADQQKKVEERTEQIQESVDGIMQEANALDVNTGEGANRATLLAQYAICQAAKDSLQSEQQQGGLALPNGSTYNIAQELDSLDQTMAGIRAWFKQNYEQSLAAVSFGDGDTAESLSSSACQQKLDALAALKATIEQEKAIWGDDTGAGSDYANLIASIDAQIAHGNELLPQITAREEEEAKNARGFIGSWSWSSSGGGAPMIHVVTFYEDGRFLSQMRMNQTTSTWSQVGDVHDGKVTLRADASTYVYDSATDTLSADGMVYARASGPIGS